MKLEIPKNMTGGNMVGGEEMVKLYVDLFNEKRTGERPDYIEKSTGNRYVLLNKNLNTLIKYEKYIQLVNEALKKPLPKTLEKKL